jgi:hypothetical protein
MEYNLQCMLPIKVMDLDDPTQSANFTSLFINPTLVNQT